jgi:hypothetical protein
MGFEVLARCCMATVWLEIADQVGYAVRSLYCLQLLTWGLWA